MLTFSVSSLGSMLSEHLSELLLGMFLTKRLCGDLPVFCDQQYTRMGSYLCLNRHLLQFLQRNLVVFRIIVRVNVRFYIIFQHNHTTKEGDFGKSVLVLKFIDL